MSGNQALDTNSVVGSHADLEITRRGSSWYFAVCAIMGASTLAFIGLSFSRRALHRIFHYIMAIITFAACIAYFSMGSNLGQVPIAVEFVRPGSRMVGQAGTREIFYARYIDWFITTPLLLLDLLLTARAPWTTILVSILAGEIMVVTGLIGALTRTSYKWGFGTFGMLALFFVTWALLVDGRRHATALGGAVRRTYLMCAVLTIGLWFLYPIAWGLSEGGNVIHSDAEAIFYGVLDILSRPVFGFLLLYGHRSIDPTAIRLHDRGPADGKQRNGDVGAGNGVTNGHGTVGNGYDGVGTGDVPAATTATAPHYDTTTHV